MKPFLKSIQKLIFAASCLALVSINVASAEETADSLIDQALQSAQAEQYANAKDAAEKALNIARKQYTNNGKKLGFTLYNIASVYRLISNDERALELLTEALTILESSLGLQDPKVAIALEALANVKYNLHKPFEDNLARAVKIYHDNSDAGGEADAIYRWGTLAFERGRFSVAEDKFAESLRLRKKFLSYSSIEIGDSLYWLAASLFQQGYYGKAEENFEEALKIREKLLGDNQDVIAAAHDVALVKLVLGKRVDGEKYAAQAVAVSQNVYGFNSPKTAEQLTQLAEFNPKQKESLLNRAVAIFEQYPPSFAAATATLALAAAKSEKGDAKGGYTLALRALALEEKAQTKGHLNYALFLYAVANHEIPLGLYANAEQRFHEAIDKFMSTKPRDGNVGRLLEGLSGIEMLEGKLKEANVHLMDALKRAEGSYGPDNIAVARSLLGLGKLRDRENRVEESYSFLRRAALIIRNQILPDFNYNSEEEDIKKEILELYLVQLKTLQDRSPAQADLLENESFEAAQDYLKGSTEAAARQMAIRFASGSDELAIAIRNLQDSRYALQMQNNRVASAIANQSGLDEINELMKSRTDLELRLKTNQEDIVRRFPKYLALSSPRPLSIAGVRDLLNEDEVLILFLVEPKHQSNGWVWVVTKHSSRWKKLDIPPNNISIDVEALRCGLNRVIWEDQVSPSHAEPSASEKARFATRSRCAEILHIGTDVELPPFDLKRAYRLYLSLFREMLDLVPEGKHLMIVPSGALSALPLHVLVVKEPNETAVGLEKFRNVEWLIKYHPISTLPAVSSLYSVRKFAPKSHAEEPFIGFGNPLVHGDPKDPIDAARAECARQLRNCEATCEFPNSVGAKSTSGVLINALAVPFTAPLPETAGEICTVAKELGLGEVERDYVSYLGDRAREITVKKLSAEKALLRYKIVEFATHGVMSGDWRDLDEPGLILTPPPDTKDAEQLRLDDGLLSQSEVAQLQLDADWIILSACNTAAGESSNSEALSGLARAFIYAGARSLLVSQWPVSTRAAAKLTTLAFRALKENATLGKAEAMRRAMRAVMLDDTWPVAAHPTYWAPFVVVGEGAYDSNKEDLN